MQFPACFKHRFDRGLMRLGDFSEVGKFIRVRLGSVNRGLMRFGDFC